MDSNFYNTNKQEILATLVKETNNLPAGTEISLSELFYTVYPEHIQEIDSFGFDLLHDYMKAAQKEGLFLDMSKHDGLTEGLPYNLDFAVFHKKPGKKCPRCGSRDTADILHGFPHFSGELENELNNHRIYPGGCKIGPADPKYHCFSCDRNFGTPPVLISKAGIEKYADIIKEITIECGGYFQGHNLIKISKTGEDCFIKKESFPSGEEDFERTISLAEGKKIIKRLYESLFIHEWKKQYIDPYVLDGEQWSIEVTLTNRRKRSIHGSNEYPAYWPEFQRWLKSVK